MKENKELPGIDSQTFEIFLDKGWVRGDYIVGCDPYDENSNSFSVGVVSTPKKEWGIKKIRGFNRLIELGWTYNVEILK